MIIGAALCAASTAFAQDEPPAGGDPPPTTDPVGNGNGSGNAATVGASMGATMGQWPKEIIARPLTLPKSVIGLYGVFDIAKRTVVTVSGTPPMATTSSSTSEALQVGAGFGVSDLITLGGEYTLTLNSFEAKGPLTFYGAYRLLHDAKMSAALSVSFTEDFNASAQTLHAGLGFRYLVAPKIALFTGTPIAPGHSDHLAIGLNSKAPITFSIPVGVALQASPELFAFVDTTIATFGISNSSNAFLFSDFIPFEVGALYAANKTVDVGAALSFIDLKHAGDFFFIGLIARAYVK